MKTLEELDKEYAEKRAKLLQEHEIASNLPLVPATVCAFNDHAYASYEADTLKEAVALAERFPAKLPYVNCKGEYRHIRPESLIKDREPDDWSSYAEISDGTPYVEASSGEGYTTFKLTFWVTAGERIMQVSIEVKRPPGQWVPRCIYNHYDWQRARPLRKHYPNVPGATTVGWAWGDTSARVTYVWGCDADFAAALTTLPEFQTEE